jgi:nucleoid DNA-binding protein
MCKRHWWALGALLGTLGLGLALNPSAGAQAPRDAAKEPAKDKEVTLKGQIAAASKLGEDDVEKMLKALGPAIRDQLRNGREVELPGLGRFRVVRVPDHKDLVNGRPATIAGSNNVEFLPVGEMVNAANSSGAVPAETVPPFEYNPLPGQTKAPRQPTNRAPTTRTP